MVNSRGPVTKKDIKIAREAANRQGIQAEYNKTYQPIKSAVIEGARLLALVKQLQLESLKYLILPINCAEL